MAEFVIEYHTLNHYEQPFYGAFLEFLILPLQTESQHVISREFQTEPSSQLQYSTNCNGFQTIRFRLPPKSETFAFRMTVKVEKSRINPFERFHLPLEDERSLLRSHDYRVDHFAYLKQSHFTLLPEDWDCPRIENDEHVFDFCQRTNGLVFQKLEYDYRHASVHNTMFDVLQDHRGVCQDFAHLMLGILRANQIPGRYVTGYLNPGPGHKGSSAIHAWVEANIPGNGWIGFDPTNNLLEDVHYIKIAHGADLDECQTLKGVVRSPGKNSTDYEVRVQESTSLNLQQ